MNLKGHPCFVGINEALNLASSHGSQRETIQDFLNKVCKDAACPLHGKGGISLLIVQMLDHMSDEELAESLRALGQ